MTPSCRSSTKIAPKKPKKKPNKLSRTKHCTKENGALSQPKRAAISLSVTFQFQTSARLRTKTGYLRPKLPVHAANRRHPHARFEVRLHVATRRRFLLVHRRHRRIRRRLRCAPPPSPPPAAPSPRPPSIRKFEATISKLVSLLIFFILPLARLNSTLDKHERSLFQILLRDSACLPHTTILVPFGPLLALAVFVLVRVIRGHRKICHACPPPVKRVAGSRPKRFRPIITLFTDMSCGTSFSNLFSAKYIRIVPHRSCSFARGLSGHYTVNILQQIVKRSGYSKFRSVFYKVRTVRFRTRPKTLQAISLTSFHIRTEFYKRWTLSALQRQTRASIALRESSAVSAMAPRNAKWGIHDFRSHRFLSPRFYFLWPHSYSSFLLGAQRVQAQASSGVTGVVTDQSSAVVPDAAVTLTNSQTGFKAETTTSSSGTYQFLRVPPGNGYTLTFSKSNLSHDRTSEPLSWAFPSPKPKTRSSKFGTTQQTVEVAARRPGHSEHGLTQHSAT